MQNENVAAIVARHPRRFVGMATVPLQDTALAVEELRDARERLGLRAVEIGTCPGGRDFDDPALFPFFAACRDLEHGRVRAPGRAAGGPGAAHEVLLPADRGQPAGDGGGHLEADLRRRARASPRSPHLLRARRRGVPVHPGPPRPRLVGAPGGPGVDPEAAAGVRAPAPLRLAHAQRREPPVPGHRVRRRAGRDGQRLPVRHGEPGPGGRRRRGGARSGRASAREGGTAARFLGL